MSDAELALALLDDLVRLAEGTAVTSIEVEADGLSVTMVRDASSAPERAGAEAARPTAERRDDTRRVHASTVGIFSAVKEWSAGDAVVKGVVLGSIQSLGAMADVVAPVDGVIREVLVTVGAPVEYGQPLFAIAHRPSGAAAPAAAGPLTTGPAAPAAAGPLTTGAKGPS